TREAPCQVAMKPVTAREAENPAFPGLDSSPECAILSIVVDIVYHFSRLFVTHPRETMTHWFCRECKRTHREEQMLPGWNGLWCPNCVWSDVTPAPAGGVARDGASEADSCDPDADSASPGI